MSRSRQREGPLALGPALCRLLLLTAALAAPVPLGGAETGQQPAAPSPPPDPRVEKALASSREGILEKLRALRAALREAARKRGGLDDRFVVTTDLLALPGIDRADRETIAERRQAVLQALRRSAEEIVDLRSPAAVDPSGEHAAARDESAKEALDRVRRWVREDNVSVTLLALAVRMPIDVAASLYGSAAQVKEPQRRADLSTESSTLVYELAAIGVDLVETFRQEGFEDLRRLYDERRQEVDKHVGRITNHLAIYEMRRDQGKLDEGRDGPEIKRLSDLRARLEASVKAWREPFQTTGAQRVWAERTRSKGVVVRDLREMAGLQIDVIKDAGEPRDPTLTIERIKALSEHPDPPLLAVSDATILVMLGLSDPPAPPSAPPSGAR